MMMLVMALLIQVHGPDGHSISINPDHIVAMHETDRPNTDKYLVGVACIINIAGKPVKEHYIALVTEPPLVLVIWFRHRFVREGELKAGRCMTAACWACTASGKPEEEHPIALGTEAPLALSIGCWLVVLEDEI